jgi:hypothetical protein
VIPAAVAGLVLLALCVRGRAPLASLAALAALGAVWSSAPIAFVLDGVAAALLVLGAIVWRLLSQD